MSALSCLAPHACCHVCVDRSPHGPVASRSPLCRSSRSEPAQIPCMHLYAACMHGLANQPAFVKIRSWSQPHHAPAVRQNHGLNRASRFVLAANGILPFRTHHIGMVDTCSHSLHGTVRGHEREERAKFGVVLTRSLNRHVTRMA